MAKEENHRLEFTGERFLPWMEGAQIHYEHLHRYAFAVQFVKGKKVLDLACGEGYGSFLLSKEAGHVVGVDIDRTAIDHAREKYTAHNLEFLEGSILDIPIEGKGKFDVIVCFEALEHVGEHEKILSEVKRLLKKEGLFIVSTPNKKTYTDDLNYTNPFHKKELYFDEFDDLLGSYFENTYFLGQKVYGASNIWVLPPYEYSKSDELVIERDGEEFRPSKPNRKVPMYFIAIASDKNLNSEIFKVNSYFVDASNYLIRELETYIEGRDTQISELRAELQKRDELTLKELEKRAEITEREIGKREETIKKFEEEIEFLRAELQKRDETINQLEDELESIKETTIFKLCSKILGLKHK